MPTIASNPAAFDMIADTPPSGDVVFAIPAGVYSSGQWNLAGTGSGASSGVPTLTGILDSEVRTFATLYNGAYSSNASVTPTQLAKMNDVAGGDYPVSMLMAGGTVDTLAVDDFELVLNETGGGGGVSRFVRVQPCVIRVTPAPTAVKTPKKVNVATCRVGVKPQKLAASNAGAVRIYVKPCRISATPIGLDGGRGGEPDPTDGGGRIAIGEDGNLLFAHLRDASGAVQTTEVVVGSATKYQAGCVWLGHGYGALYTRGGRVFWKVTADPTAWAAAETDTGLNGMVYGVAVNTFGVIGAIVGNQFVRSRDGGLTWGAGAAVPWPSGAKDRTLIAQEHRFIIVTTAGERVAHLVTENGGDSWS